MTEHESTEVADTETEEPRERIDVRVGDRTVTVGRFRGYTATKIMREAAAIGRRYPRLSKDIAAYKRDYEAENSITLTRAEAEMKLGTDATKISEAAWEAAGQQLTLRRSPAIEEQMVAVWPDLLEHAEEHVIRLLALLAIDRQALEEAYDTDDVDDALSREGKRLLFDGDAAELLELALAGVEVGRAQFAPLRDRASKLLAQLGITSKSTPAPAPSSQTTSPETTTSPDQGPEESTTSGEDSPTTSPSSETRPSSSTDLEAPTDGAEAQRSSDTAGSSFEPSPIG